LKQQTTLLPLERGATDPVASRMHTPRAKRDPVSTGALIAVISIVLNLLLPYLIVVRSQFQPSHCTRRYAPLWCVHRILSINGADHQLLGLNPFQMRQYFLQTSARERVQHAERLVQQQ
jgi:hypothetical protein